jgi:hypothetical protein
MHQKSETFENRVPSYRAVRPAVGSECTGPPVSFLEILAFFFGHRWIARFGRVCFF